MFPLDWKSASALVSIVIACSSVVWSAAQYPTQDDIDKVKIEVKLIEDRAMTEVREVREETIAIKSDLKHIKESQARIERMLESILEKRYKH